MKLIRETKKNCLSDNDFFLRGLILWHEGIRDCRRQLWTNGGRVSLLTFFCTCKENKVPAGRDRHHCNGWEDTDTPEFSALKNQRRFASNQTHLYQREDLKPHPGVAPPDVALLFLLALPTFIFSTSATATRVESQATSSKKNKLRA